jgi:carbamate kinase
VSEGPTAVEAAREPGDRTFVVALGGNAILRRGDDGSLETQMARADEAMVHVARLAATGAHIALTHGNGPVVGNIVLRNEAARDQVPPMPLFIAGADSEGGIGLMLQLSLENALLAAGVERQVAIIVTQTIVDVDDPAFRRPTKPIGPYYSTQRLAELRAAEPSWSFAEAPGLGGRRCVPSPRPLRIVEADVIGRLVHEGIVTIAAGGGGVPVAEDSSGRRRGMDAVIDKDWASALLAAEIGADALAIVMEADRVYADWGTDRQRPLDRLSVDEAGALLASGQLDEGSVGPKVAASAWFAERTGHPAVVCRVEDLDVALQGRAGTRIG